MIKHAWILRKDGSKIYVCNQAVKVTEEKLAKTPDEVNCKNCLNMGAEHTLGPEE